MRTTSEARRARDEALVESLFLPSVARPASAISSTSLDRQLSRLQLFPRVSCAEVIVNSEILRPVFAASIPSGYFVYPIDGTVITGRRAPHLSAAGRRPPFLLTSGSWAPGLAGHFLGHTLRRPLAAELKPKLTFVFPLPPAPSSKALLPVALISAPPEPFGR